MLGAQLAAGLTGRAGDMVPLGWMLLVADGLVCFLAITCPVRVWLPLMVPMTGVIIGVIGVRFGADPAALRRLGAAFYALAAFQIVLLMCARVRGTTTGITVRAARAELDLAAERAAAIAVRHDRILRLRQLADDPLPLLADIGAGVLDPRDPAVRRRCAASAAALRRTLTSQPRPAAVVTAFESAVRVAEERGACVEIQVAGNVDSMPAPVEDEVAGTVAGILAGIDGGRVLVTLIGDGADGSLVITFAAPDPRLTGPGPADPRYAEPGAAASPPGDRQWVDVVEEVEDGQVCIEIRWGSSRLAHLPG
jgi:hypothetical protein